MKTKELDPRFHKALMAAFNQRQLGDYALESGLGKEDIDQLLVEAKDFLKAGRSWLNEQGKTAT